MSEWKEKTVQHTLCMPLCGRMIAVHKYPDAERIVQALGVDNSGNPFYRLQYWYCLDMEDVISLRERLIPKGEHERNIVCDLNDFSWFDKIEFDPAEGIDRSLKSIVR